MRMEIISVVLWRRGHASPPRILSFEPGIVNVIPGGNDRGKTTIMHMIEYCLGEPGCSIAREPQLRGAVEWVGLHLRLPSAGPDQEPEVLVARRVADLEHEERDFTNDYFLVQGRGLRPAAQLPRPSAGGGRQVLSELSRLAGLDEVNLLEEREDPTRATGPGQASISVHDLTPLLLVPSETLISRADILFMKHVPPHMVKRILPYSIGIVGAAELARSREIVDERRRRGQSERELAPVRYALTHLDKAMRLTLGKARAAGADVPNVLPARLEQLVELLRSAQSQLPTQVPATVPEGLTDERRAELTHLEQEIARLNGEIVLLEQQRAALDKVARAAPRYTEGLTQIERGFWGLAETEEQFTHAERCFVCGSAEGVSGAMYADFSETISAIRAEVHAFDGVSEQSEAVVQERARIGGEIKKLKERLSELRRGGEQIRAMLPEHQRFSEAALQLAVLQSDIARLLHDEWAELAPYAARELELRRIGDGIQSLEDDLKAQRQLSRDGRREVQETLNTAILDYARIMELVGPEGRVEFNPSSISLRVDRDGRDVLELREVGGSGKHVGYKVAVLLALHERFIDVRHSPVPSFLFLDAPGSADSGRADRNTPSSETDEQRALTESMTSAIFFALNKAMERTHGRLQVIVTTRDGQDEMWSGLPRVHRVKSWDETGGYLVPLEWLEGLD